MHIEVANNNGTKYLKPARCHRGTNSKGKKTMLGAEFGKDLDWTYGLPGARVAKALADWQVNELPGEYYQMLNASGEDIGLLFKAFGLEILAKIYTNGDIRNLKSAVNPF